MSIHNILFVFIILTVFSCKKIKTKEESISIIDSTKTSIYKINEVIISLNPKAQKVVKNWGEYQKVDEFIKQYREISSTDALLNAKELSELVKQLKDSMRIEKFNISSVKIRINVLYNETLRLSDMATIPSISKSDINQENINILNAYSALNSKLNNIISQENLNNEINNFISEITNSPDSLIKNSNKKKIDTILIKKQNETN